MWVPNRESWDISTTRLRRGAEPVSRTRLSKYFFNYYFVWQGINKCRALRERKEKKRLLECSEFHGKMQSMLNDNKMKISKCESCVQL